MFHGFLGIQILKASMKTWFYFLLRKDCHYCFMDLFLSSIFKIGKRFIDSPLQAEEQLYRPINRSKKTEDYSNKMK